MLCERGLERRLVGFILVDPAGPMPEECHLVIRDGDIVGRVTSIAHSPTLGRAIGLAYVAPDQAAPGSRFTIKESRGRRSEEHTSGLQPLMRSTYAVFCLKKKHEHPGLPHTTTNCEISMNDCDVFHT